MEIKFVIPLEPRTKKNSQQIVYNKKLGRAMVIQSAKYKEYEKQCGSYVPLQDEPIDYPINVKATFYRGTRRRVDKSNLEAALHDILVKYKLLADDCRDVIASTDGSRVLYDKENPRTEVVITPFEEEYEVWSKSK